MAREGEGEFYTPPLPVGVEEEEEGFLPVDYDQLELIHLASYGSAFSIGTTS